MGTSARLRPMLKAMRSIVSRFWIVWVSPVMGLGGGVCGNRALMRV